MRIHIIICFYCFMHFITAMASHPSIGAKALSMGGCGLMLSDVFTPVNNMALMCDVKKPVMGFSLTNRYLLAEVNDMAVCVVIPLKKLAYGLQCTSYGNKTYSELGAGISGAYAPFKSFSFGIGAAYHHLTITGHGHRSNISADMAISSRINDHLKFAFSCKGLFTLVVEEKEKNLQTYRIGLLYKINTKVELIVEAEKDNIFKTGLKTGLKYQLKDGFYACVGFSSMQPQYTFGIGFRKPHYQLEFASSVSVSPGITGNMTFIYEIEH